MSVSALNRAKLLLKTSARLATLAAPLVAASHASASATGWVMQSSSVSGTDSSGSTLQYPTSDYGFGYSQISNTGIKISGQFGPVSPNGSSGGGAQYLGNSTEVAFFGFMAEPWSEGQVIDTDITVQFLTSGGQIEVLEASTVFVYESSGGAFVSGLQTFNGESPGSGGVFNASYFTNPLPTSGFGGQWSFKLKFNWVNAGQFDTLQLIVPNDSVDLNLTVPAPGAAGLLALGGLMSMRRRRR